MPDSIYFMEEAGALNHSGSGLFWDVFSMENYRKSEITLTAENTGGQAAVTDSRAVLKLWNTRRYKDDRSNCDLEEAAEAAMENRVFFGTNRLEYAYSLDYSETHLLSLEDPVTVTLLPYDALEGKKCLYYTLFYLDGSREDLLTDPDSGEILDRTFVPAE